MKRLTTLLLILALTFSFVACESLAPIESESATFSSTVASETESNSEVESKDVIDNESPTENLIAVPDVWSNLLEKHFEEIKLLFVDAGFTNITCLAHEIDYNEDNVFEGSVFNIAIGENREICTFEKDALFPKDVQIIIDYRTKPANEDPKDESSEIEPSDDSSAEEPSETESEHEKNEDDLVWIPTNGGTKYHSKSSCSGMKNPRQVSKETAIEEGFTACKKCF